MPRGREGFAVYEVVLGLVLLGLLSSAVVRTALAIGAAVDEGRGWTRMAAAATTELARLELAFRAGAPACIAPASGTGARLGIRLDWRVVDSLPMVRITVVARARAARRFLVDSLTSSFVCR